MRFRPYARDFGEKKERNLNRASRRTRSGLSTSRHFILLFSAAFFCSGCFPRTFPETPGIHGQLLDANTGSPLKNGTVTALLEEPTKVTAISHTDVDGRFDIAPRNDTAWMFINFDLAYSDVTIIFEAPGYVTQQIKNSPFQEWSGIMRLKPVPATSAQIAPHL